MFHDDPGFNLRAGNFECYLWGTEGFVYQYKKIQDGTKIPIAAVKFEYIADGLLDVDDAFTTVGANSYISEPVFSTIRTEAPQILPHDSAQKILISLFKALEDPSPTIKSPQNDFSLHKTSNNAALTIIFKGSPYACFDIVTDRVYRIDHSKQLIEIIARALPNIWLELDHVALEINSPLNSPGRPKIIRTPDVPAIGANDNLKQPIL